MSWCQAAKTDRILVGIPGLRSSSPLVASESSFSRLYRTRCRPILAEPAYIPSPPGFARRASPVTRVSLPRRIRMKRTS